MPSTILYRNPTPWYLLSDVHAGIKHARKVYHHGVLVMHIIPPNPIPRSPSDLNRIIHGSLNPNLFPLQESQQRLALFSFSLGNFSTSFSNLPRSVSCGSRLCEKPTRWCGVSEAARRESVIWRGSAILARQLMHRWICRRMDHWMDCWMGHWMDRWIDCWMGHLVGNLVGNWVDNWVDNWVYNWVNNWMAHCMCCWMCSWLYLHRWIGYNCWMRRQHRGRVGWRGHRLMPAWKQRVVLHSGVSWSRLIIPCRLIAILVGRHNSAAGRRVVARRRKGVLNRVLGRDHEIIRWPPSPFPVVSGPPALARHRGEQAS